MQSRIPLFYEILGIALTAGCLLHPASSAFGLLVVCVAKLGERYFTRNIADSDREELQSLKSEFAKVKLKVEQESFSKAFQR